MKNNFLFPPAWVSFLLTVGVFFFVSCSSFDEDAAVNDIMNTANMQRALDAMGEEDYENALKFLQRELDDQPDNGCAHAQMAWLISAMDGSNEKALVEANKALDLLPRKFKKQRAFVYRTRAHIYEKMEDYDKAIGDFDAAVKCSPDNADLYEERGDYLFRRKDYDRSSKDYQKYIELKPSDVIGYMGMGRNALRSTHYAKSLEWFNKAVDLCDEDYSAAYAFRAQAFCMIDNYDRASDDIVKALSIDYSQKAFYVMMQVAEKSIQTIAARIEVEANKQPYEAYWPFCLGALYGHVGDYPKAISYFQAALGLENQPVFYRDIANCWDALGDVQKALESINRAISPDNPQFELLERRISYNHELGNRKAVLSELDDLVNNWPDDADVYGLRGWFRWLYGDLAGSERDMSAAISMGSSDAQNYLVRGCIRQANGDRDAAVRDWKHCVVLYKEDTTCRANAAFALHYLGHEKWAEELMDTVLMYEPEEIYDAACLYALMGKTQSALDLLRKAVEDNQISIPHVICDPDLASLRNEDEYKRIIARKPPVVSISNSPKTSSNTHAVGSTTARIVEIPFIRRGGAQEVTCQVNGLPLKMILDTGADVVSISATEASFMLKNGYLSSRDIIGKGHYSTASGEIVEGTEVILRSISIGGLTINGVRASVVHSQNAPILLGQSVLKRFGKYEVDNVKQVVRISE